MLDVPEGNVRARVRRRVPIVLTRDEVQAVFRGLEGTPELVALLLYGSGLRLLEALRLRVKDVDLSLQQLVIHDGKSRRDRRTVLAASAVEPLRAHLREQKPVHERDLARGHGTVELPGRLATKSPGALARVEVAVGVPGNAGIHRSHHR